MEIGMSRTELIAWVNELLQINYTKVEQCGTGAAYCQIVDSIFLTVPMSKVKFNARQEYEYVNNYKVLQNIFKKHGVDKPVPVERLVKCKMQDNLEFLQWLRKFWDMHFPGGDYDPVGRRKGVPGAAPEAPLSRSGRSSSTAPVSARPAVSAPVSAAARRPGSLAGGAAARPGSRPSSTMRGGAASDAAVQALTSQMNEMKLNVEGLEKERDFYFNKLREIEILIQARLESGDEQMTDNEHETLKQIEAILYQTEDGFEVPDEEEIVDGEQVPGDEETF